MPASTYNYFLFIEAVPVTEPFTSVSGLGSEISVAKETIVDPDTGDTVIESISGRPTFTDIVLTRPVTENDGFWRWHKDIIENKDRRANCSIAARDASNRIVAWWNIEKAWPSKIVVSELKSSTSEVLEETITLSHGGITRVPTNEITG
ncbi:MAG: phage tail protein [Anaerolineae bacterium]|nr:phage tail protein [Anaerolineae bacterium]